MAETKKNKNQKKTKETKTTEKNKHKTKPISKTSKKETKKTNVKTNTKPIKENKNTKTKIKRKSKGIRGSKEVQKIALKVQAKKRVTSRGRFGKRNAIRKISNKKWQKWRKARGTDIDPGKEHGPVPKTGRSSAKTIRNKHPSGFSEMLVRNQNDIKKASKIKNMAIRIASTIGKRKKKIFLEQAQKLKLKVLN